MPTRKEIAVQLSDDARIVRQQFGAFAAIADRMDAAAMYIERSMKQVAVDEAMVSRALHGFDTGTGDPNDYRRRMRAALEAVITPKP